MTRPTDVAPDLIEDIFLRLPVKSLLRFKCVSKFYNSLISNPAFARMHLQRSWRTYILTSTPSGLSLLDYETSFREEIRLRFPPKRQNDRVRIIGSCHGLVVLALEGYKNFFIWNPLTGDYKKLPDPCFPSAEDGLFYGFGYDSSTDDYKLVFSIERSHWLVAIFSLRKNSWRMIQSPPTNTVFSPHQNISGCFVNEALNWLSGRLPTQEILTFDLKTERFSRVPVTNQGNMGFISTNVGVLDVGLCFTSYNVFSFRIYDDFEFFFGEPPTYPVEIWVMKEYGVWNKLLTMLDKYNSWHLPLCMSKGKEFILLDEQKELIRSGAEGSILERFRICKCDPEIFYFSSIFEHPCQAIVYAESLLSPNVNIIEDEQQIQGRTRKRKNIL